MVAIEVTLLLLSFIGILLYYFDISSDLVLVRAVNFVAIVYFFFTCFDPFEAKDHQITDVIPKIIAIGFTLAVLGALFKLINYPAQEMAAKIGVVSMSIAALIRGFKSHGSWSNHLVAIRVSLIATLCLVLWFL